MPARLPRLPPLGLHLALLLLLRALLQVLPHAQARGRRADAAVHLRRGGPAGVCVYLCVWKGEGLDGVRRRELGGRGPVCTGGGPPLASPLRCRPSNARRPAAPGRQHASPARADPPRCPLPADPRLPCRARPTPPRAWARGTSRAWGGAGSPGGARSGPSSWPWAWPPSASPPGAWQSRSSRQTPRSPTSGVRRAHTCTAQNDARRWPHRHAVP